MFAEVKMFQVVECWICYDLLGAPALTFKIIGETKFPLPPGRLTWNLRIHPWKRKIIFQTIIFRFHVNLRGCFFMVIKRKTLVIQNPLTPQKFNMEPENDGFQKIFFLFKGAIFRFYVCSGGCKSYRSPEDRNVLPSLRKNVTFWEGTHSMNSLFPMIHGTGIFSYIWLKSMVNVGRNSVIDPRSMFGKQP